jgi:hypothetical protein
MAAPQRLMPDHLTRSPMAKWEAALGEEAGKRRLGREGLLAFGKKGVRFKSSQGNGTYSAWILT